MPSTLAHTTCAICGLPFEHVRDALVTLGTVHPAHPLFDGFSATLMHPSCYERWPERATFSRAAVEGAMALLSRRFDEVPIFRDDLVAVSVSLGVPPDPRWRPHPPEVRLWLLEIGRVVEIPLSAWDRWVNASELPDIELHAFERQALAAARLGLRDALPSAAVIHASIDWPAQRALAKAYYAREAAVEVDDAGEALDVM
jgi:hypothetical protein